MEKIVYRILAFLETSNIVHLFEKLTTYIWVIIIDANHKGEHCWPLFVCLCDQEVSDVLANEDNSACAFEILHSGLVPNLLRYVVWKEDLPRLSRSENPFSQG